MQVNPMVSKRITDLDPALQKLAQELLERCEVAGVEVHLTQTFSHRGDLGPHGCTLPNRIAAARAFDFGIRCGENDLEWSDDDWECQTVRAIGKAPGLDFGACDDGEHFVLPDWRVKI
jgi:hypothetical protein